MSAFISDSVFVSGKRNRTLPKHFRLGKTVNSKRHNRIRGNE